MVCWPRYANVLVDKPYKGWPITISQFDNYPKKAVAWLPELIIEGIENPVVEVREAESNKLVYCVRIVGKKFKPKTFAPGMYSIKINNTQNDVSKYLNNIEAKKENSEIIKVTL